MPDLAHTIVGPSRRAVLGVGALLAMAGCAPHSSGTATRASLVLGDQVHLTRSRLEAAGAFSDLGFDVRWADFPGAAPLLEALNAGAVDTALAGDIPIILAAAVGCPLKIVGATRSSPRSIGVIVPRGSTIRSISDLKGRRVIVSSARGSISHYLLLELLEQVRLSAKDVDIGFLLPGAAAAAFAAGHMDAWATFGVYQAAAEADGARVLRDGEGVSPGLGLIAVADKALSDPVKHRALADFMQRLRRADLWSASHRPEYARIFARQTGVPIPIADVIAHRENATLSPPDASIIATLQHAADRLLHFGVISQRIDLTRFVDASLLAEAAAN